MGLAEPRSPRCPAWGEAKGELPRSAGRCPVGVLAPRCRPAPAGAPSPPLAQSPPCSTRGCHSPGFPSTSGEAMLAAKPGSNHPPSISTEFKQGQTGEGYRKQTDKPTEQTDDTFIYPLRLRQRFLFALQCRSGKISCFTARGQRRYGLSCARCLPVTARAEQVLNKLFACRECLCLFLPEDSTFRAAPRQTHLSPKALLGAQYWRRARPQPTPVKPRSLRATARAEEGEACPCAEEGQERPLRSLGQTTRDAELKHPRSCTMN